MAKQRSWVTDIMVGDEGQLDPHAIAALKESTDELYRNISNENIRTNSIDARKLRSVKLKDVKLYQNQVNRVPHGLGTVPYFYIMIPQDNLIWYEEKEPDKNYLYLRTSGTKEYHILVFG